MKKYIIAFYNEDSCEGETEIKARSRNHAIRKMIKINKKYYNCKYVQIYAPLFHKGSIKIFGNGNKYLYGKKNGKKVNVNGPR